MNSFFTAEIFLTGLFSLVCLNSPSQQLPRGIQINAGYVNGVSIERTGKILAIYGDPGNRLNKADMILFTHFRRDVIASGYNLIHKGAMAFAPMNEKEYFSKGDSIWSNFLTARFHDYQDQTTKNEIVPVKINHYVRGGETFTWQGIDIKVFDTPGYTRGSVTYLMEIDNKKFAFTGDLIYGDGKIMDLYSFQDSLGPVGGYHGYATRLGKLVSSLRLIAALKPDVIIPARGPVIYDPGSAITKLMDQIHLLYANYLSASAYRWYFPERMNLLLNHVTVLPEDVKWMPYAEIQKDPPQWYTHVSNSNLIFADDSSAFLIDCGSRQALNSIREMRKSGRLKRLDGIFITHYHDDHTNFINDVVNEFGCPVYATRELKEILEDPSSFHMPCLTNDPIRNLTIAEDGQKMRWKDFTLTFYYFPGQTIYHDAVLFEKERGQSVFFIGDSFTPSGIDDYCLLNRNFLHPATGYFYCIDILKKLKPGILLSNQHVAELFSFSNDQLDFMYNNLLERRRLLSEMMPWDDINYGLDEQWIRIVPYMQKAQKGQRIEFSVKIMNHSGIKKTFRVTPFAPEGSKIEPPGAMITLNPLEEGGKSFYVTLPENVPDIILLKASVKFDKWLLYGFTESLIETH